MHGLIIIPFLFPKRESSRTSSLPCPAPHPYPSPLPIITTTLYIVTPYNLVMSRPILYETCMTSNHALQSIAADAFWCMNIHRCNFLPR